MNTESVKSEKVKGKIPTLQAQQTKLIEELHSAISNLDKSLDTVLSREPAADCEAKPETPTPNYVYSMLEKSNKGIDCAIGRIHGLNRLLEL